MVNLFKREIPIDSRQEFYKTIYDYYFKALENKVQPELLVEMSDRITDYSYEQYTRFRKQYPRSVKRYSSFQIKDLDHPHIFEIIINYFKEKTGDNYSDNVMTVLGWSLEKLKEFEKSREDFYNKF